MSCVISYIFVTLITSVNLLTINNKLIENPLVISGISIILSVVFGLISARLYTSKRINKYVINKFHKSLHDDIWRDVFDFDKGSNLKVYLKDEEYYLIGHYKCHEEKECESWLALSGFGKFDKVTNKNYKEEPNFLSNDSIIIAIRFNDIAHIEIF